MKRLAMWAIFIAIVIGTGYATGGIGILAATVYLNRASAAPTENMTLTTAVTEPESLLIVAAGAFALSAVIKRGLY